MRYAAHQRWLAIFLALATASCAEGSTDFHARYEPGFTPGPTTVSVFGVFHEGRMSPDTWAQISPQITSVLGQKACATGYGYQLASADPALYAAVDETVRDEGITLALLERFAAKAEGELILVLTLNGHTTVGHNIDGSVSRGPRRQPGVSAPPGRSAALNELAISATLFSVSRRRSVARLNMVYSGSNLEDAMDKFAVRLRDLMPGARCRGWRWEGVEPR